MCRGPHQASEARPPREGAGRYCHLRVQKSMTLAAWRICHHRQQVPWIFRSQPLLPHLARRRRVRIIASDASGWRRTWLPRIRTLRIGCTAGTTTTTHTNTSTTGTSATTNTNTNNDNNNKANTNNNTTEKTCAWTSSGDLRYQHRAAEEAVPREAHSRSVQLHPAGDAASHT